MPRRDLKPFASFGDVLADAYSLLAAGYDRAGSWSLGQCCGHLANWCAYQLDGFPRLPLPLKPVFFALRNTVAGGMFRKAIAGGTMPAGSPTAPHSIPPTDADDRAEVDRLRLAYRRWENHAGPLVPSPLFGSQTKDDWRKLHLLHAAHHLSFLTPTHA